MLSVGRTSDLVVIVEGNYLAFDHACWAELASQFDEIWFVECPIDVAMARVVERHIAQCM
jgi:pantothenate kinase